MNINKNKAGLAFGAFLGVCHLTWSVVVAIGLAQPFMDWIFKLHFIQPPYTIAPFNVGIAATLVIVTSSIGYVSGWVMAAIWNRIHS